jgi:spoIIIJ-associated protein
MIREYIGTGKTVEDAATVAKAGLNAPLTADVKIEVVEYPKKKILGLFGGADAKVKASYDDGKKENKAPKKQNHKKPAEPKKQAKAQKPAPKKEAQKKVEAPKPEPTKDYPQTVDLEYAKQHLAEILKGLKIEDVKIDAEYDQGIITLNLDASDYGIVIGRRGETLDAIQYLLSLIMKKNANGYVRVIVNVGNYREKRYETLQNLARKNADRVLRTGRRYTFEPMNPYERRVIHTAIQDIEGVESRSIGYNQDRKVVIEPVGGVKAQRRSNYRPNNSRQQKVTAPAEKRAPKADRADLPKFGKIEVNK